MKNFSKILFVFFLLVPFSCSDFLDLKPQNILTQEAFPKSAADALQATNATYATLRNWFYHSGGYPILDIMSDDARKGSNPDDQRPTVGPYDNFTHNASQDGLDRWWAAVYEGIKRANVVINAVPLVEMDENLKNRYVGEAKFLRALFYFDLVRAWGGVPIVTEVTAEFKIPRATSAQVYSLIETDLQDAIQVLPKKSEYSIADLGRATQGAAQALLGKVHLYQGEFEEAEDLLLEVIDSDEYDLENDFDDAFGAETENGIESVFEIGARLNEGTNNGGNQWGNVQGIRGTPNRGWGFNRPSVDLINSFETGDPRREATVIFLGETMPDGVVTLGDGTTPDETRDAQNNLIEIECYNQKIWTPGNNTITSWGHNRRIIRYADVLLMAAEALNENSKSTDALIYLNQVRQRAREGNNAILPDINITDKTQLRDIILNERRYELAMESHRYWDLVRHIGRSTSALQKLQSLGFVQGKHELFPIPQNEFDLAQGNFEQNPNWD